MRTNINKNCKSGAALLIVLFVIMVITLVGMGFIAKTDSELACGNNMVLRTQMDNLAKSGLEHAKGLLVNPWDVSVSSGKYWLGQTAIQFDGGNDYYDIEILKDSSGTTPRLQYSIMSTGSRMRNGEVVGQSSLSAKLRFDPAIAIWCDSALNLDDGFTINGDVYCGLDFMNNGAMINGDVYYVGMVNNFGTIVGQSQFVTQAPVGFSNINYADFTTNYNYEDGSTYSVTAITPGTYSGQSWSYSSFNPAGVFYCNGNLTLNGNMNINGMLVVNGLLTIAGTGNTIDAVRNYPAVVVNGWDGLMINSDTTLTINGLAQIPYFMIDWSAVNVNVRINGALHLQFSPAACFTSSMGSFVVNADPIESAIQVWPSSTPGQPYRWVSAGGAYIKDVSR